MSEMKLGFEMQRVRLALTDITPVRQFKDLHNIKRYRIIRASIKEVGLIEPLIVYPQKGGTGKYFLLDGRLRYSVLKDWAMLKWSALSPNRTKVSPTTRASTV
jgi:ParB-like chromosome segregation protein Spo0J